MAPPVRFFEQLMPGTRQASARVRAALPSRFAPQPFELGSLQAVARDDGADTGAAARDQGVLRLHGAPQERDTSAEGTSPPRVERAARVGEPVVATTRSPVRASPVETDALDVSASEPLPASPPTPQRADIAPARQEKAVARDASALAPVSRAASVAAKSAQRRAPLREHVREQRHGPPPGPPPTIVHVTIDRIDVRAPATGAAPERPVSRPRKESWKSLGEYLRQRERPNGGAP